MNVRCELVNYDNKESPSWISQPLISVSDAGKETEMVRINIGDNNTGFTSVMVYGEELIEAVRRCMKAKWTTKEE